MIKIIIFLSIILNIILIFFLNKKKIKKIIYKKKIKEIDISKVHEIFEFEKISSNLLGPKENAIIKSFCISPDNKVIGMTSDYEAWILSTLSKISNKIFEFGTCSGKTTFLMALNSPEEAKIYTITLNLEMTNDIKKNNLDNRISFRNIKNESTYEKFLFSGSEVEKKINVIFENSINFNENKYQNSFDLIFIDGGHTYSIVKNDSEKSFKMINKNGIILWHDYVPGKESAKDVVKYLHTISKGKKIYHIKNTSLCYYKNNE
tara:strand:+ start:59 stop:844 length:786 start_codon:yes stop_codon:yes gene_type:complete